MPVDRERVEAATRELLLALSEDPGRVGLRDTPRRVAEAYGELFSGYDTDPVKLLEALPGERASAFIFVKDVEVVSFCEHHLLPFIGVATIGYLPGPDGQICGLSKLSRLIEVLSRRLQVQERLVAQAADALAEALQPRGVFVMVDAEHLCMTLRGARKPGARMVTIETRGIFDQAEERAQILHLVTNR
jgi:GTP cyclohydrolase I